MLKVHYNYLLMRKDDFKEVFVFSLLSEGKMFGMLLVYPQCTSGVVNPRCTRLGGAQCNVSWCNGKSHDVCKKKKHLNSNKEITTICSIKNEL